MSAILETILSGENESITQLYIITTQASKILLCINLFIRNYLQNKLEHTLSNTKSGRPYKYNNTITTILIIRTNHKYIKSETLKKLLTFISSYLQTKGSSEVAKNKPQSIE